MVLRFLGMRMAMLILFACNIALIIDKVGDSKGVLPVGNDSWKPLFPVMVIPCASLR